ncbi:MAG: sigma-70 family RNA polymerase sigma factor [Gemmatimonadetes bacterium]|nr:sigma-70 family RNA polymerase sigma factor [Gemmatimonadota bacterium]
MREHTDTVMRTIEFQIRDGDDRMDAYLFVMEKLSEENCRRLRAFAPENQTVKCTFATWLKLITRNLVIDWIRSQQGRRRMPREIAALPPVARAVFRSIYWQNMTHAEAVEEVNARENVNLQVSEVQDHIATIEERLSDTYRKSLATFWMARRSPMVALDDLISVKSERAWSSPESWLRRAEIRDGFRTAIAQLGDDDRRLAILRFEKDLTAREIAEEIGVDDYTQLYPKLAKVVEHLRLQLRPLLDREGTGKE